MAGLAGTLGGIAGSGAKLAAAGTAGVAGAGVGFVGGIISPVIKFFNDLIKQRIAAADEAGVKREKYDDKIVEICKTYWNEDDVVEETRPGMPPGMPPGVQPGMLPGGQVTGSV